jgi:hypothetical protein
MDSLKRTSLLPSVAMPGTVSAVLSRGGSRRRRGRRLGRVLPLPDVRQELVQFLGQREGELCEDAPQVALRINSMPLGAGDQRIQQRRCLAGPVVAREEPVLSLMQSSA